MQIIIYGFMFMADRVQTGSHLDVPTSCANWFFRPGFLLFHSMSFKVLTLIISV